MTWVKFSDVVKRANTKEDRFKTERLYYVGGEHIDSDDVLVHNRGLIAGSTIGPMFYFGFKAGQILFVTRNPHLRKCALVPFDGICSEKTFVLETKNEEALCQRYLAWVMQTDVFWKFCEENKSGSVNFFVNWSTLAEYEFELPPIEEQRRLADLLWAANDLKEAYKRAIVASDEMLKAKFREMFDGKAKNGTINDLVSSKIETVKKKYQQGETFRYIDISSVDGTFAGIGECSIFSAQNAPSRAQQCVKKGDILYSTVRPNLKKMAISNFDDEYHVASTGFCILRPNEGNYGYLQAILLSDDFVNSMTDIAKGTSYPAVSDGQVRKYAIYLPTVQEKVIYCKIIDNMMATKQSLSNSINFIDATIKGIINQALED